MNFLIIGFLIRKGNSTVGWMLILYTADFMWVPVTLYGPLSLEGLIPEFNQD